MSLRGKGLGLLLAAFVLRVLHRAMMVEFAEPYEGPTGLPELVTTWFETAAPIAVEVLFLASVVAGTGLLVAPLLFRQEQDFRGSDVEHLDA